MTQGRISIEALRERCDQEFDGEAHLTNEELLALVEAVEAAYDHETVSGRYCCVCDVRGRKKGEPSNHQIGCPGARFDFGRDS